jgi:mRNA interferase MazF
MWKRRPVIILSKTTTLYGAVVIVPCSTQIQTDSRLAYKLQTTIDGRDAWAICDKITTVAVSRLVQDKTGRIRRLGMEEFHQVLGRVLDLLPSLPG